MTGLVAPADRMRNLVGVENVGAARCKAGRDFRLAAADAAGEPDEIRHRHEYQPLISAGPKKSAMPPAIARYGPNASGML